MLAARRNRFLMAGVSVLAVGLWLPSLAHADDYTDLLSLLRAKGTISRSEYNSLLAKHMGHRAGRSSETTMPTESETQAQQAQTAAAQAAASAALAQQMMSKTETMLSAPDIVHADPYVPGKGITMTAGNVSVNVSGFVNGFYVFNAPGSGTPVAGGLSSDGSGFDSSSVRNGLLPAGFITKISTTQDGIDLAAVFGMYPGIDSSNTGSPFNANSGGSPVALGTAGIDFRQVYVTAGNATFGTIKVGRDIGLFGSDAILNDATLLGVGSPGSNSAPGNTSLGRIGIGYVYTDFLPQITYITPILSGFQGSVGIFTPLDEVNFAGGGLSATSIQHNTPMFQGKATYDAGTSTKVHLWASMLVQPQQNVVGTGVTNGSVTAVAGDVGGKVDFGPLGLLAYYYRGSGLGTTALFFDGIAPNGKARTSDGGYAQVSYKIIPKLKLVGSYGISRLDLAAGEVDPLLIKSNQSEIGGVYYSLTDWMTLVGEFAHTVSYAHGPDQANDNTISLGTIVFF